MSRLACENYVRSLYDGPYAFVSIIMISSWLDMSVSP